MNCDAIIRLGRGIAAGLAAAHARGLVHRDIKPANLWLQSPGDTTKVLDFGLARPTTEDVRVTSSGVIAGTPAYLSPEQVRVETTQSAAFHVDGQFADAPADELVSGKHTGLYNQRLDSQ